MEEPTRLCLRCGAVIVGCKRSKYCCHACSKAVYRERYEKRPRWAGNIPSGTIGAMAELIVAADLMRRGYHVFRALSPSCPCDLAILREGRLVRVEVRTGHRYNGKVVWPKKEPITHDIYAVVVHSSNEIIYEPDLM